MKRRRRHRQTDKTSECETDTEKELVRQRARETRRELRDGAGSLGGGGRRLLPDDGVRVHILWFCQSSEPLDPAGDRG